MRIGQKTIGLQAVIAPLLSAVLIAVLIATFLPSDGEDGAGVAGVLAILAGAICVGGVALWALVSAPVHRHQPTIVPSHASASGELRPATIGPSALPSPAYAAAVTLTVVTLAQAGSFEMPAPTRDGSLHLGKAANGTPVPEAGEKAGA
jgi:hypothetical protein